MEQLAKCKREQAIKAKHRTIQCPPKQYPGVRKLETQNVPRSLMFSRLFKEVKQEFKDRTFGESRRSIRSRMISLARKTMLMMREKGAHKAPKGE